MRGCKVSLFIATKYNYCMNMKNKFYNNYCNVIMLYMIHKWYKNSNGLTQVCMHVPCHLNLDLVIDEIRS